MSRSDYTEYLDGNSKAHPPRRKLENIILGPKRYTILINHISHHYSPHPQTKFLRRKTVDFINFGKICQNFEKKMIYSVRKSKNNF